MSLIKLGVSSLNLTPLDWEGNLKIISSAIERAKSSDVSVLCLPELTITGYGCEDAFLSYGIRKLAEEFLIEATKLTKGLCINLGLPCDYNGKIYNCSAFIADKKIIGIQPKRYLAKDGIHYEPRWFEPWITDDHSKERFLVINQEKIPFGNLIFSSGELKIGFEICEDAWVNNRPAGELKKQGVNLILNPSGSHFAFNKFKKRKELVRAGSENCVYLYSNLQGNEAGRVIYDGGILIANNGAIISQGKRFSYSDFELITANINLNCLPFKAGEYKEVRFGFKKKVVDDNTVSNLGAENWEDSKELKKEEFTRAVSLGLFDYMRKSRSQGFVVSLSGGADSSAVSCLVKFSLKFAQNELGLNGLKNRLGYINNISNLSSVDEIANKLLTCVYQATKNSSLVTENAAETIAKALGATFYVCSVDELVDNYTSIIESLIGRKLCWDTDDIALQNIQARVRGPLVWYLANLTGSLLLATSNRSESAVGYTTMDGDTCGGLSPVAGIDKAFLIQWLSWVEREGIDGIGRMPELSVITSQKPTAELRLSAEGQTDEKDLMPYVVLDAIERLAIKNRKLPQEIFKQIKLKFPEYSEAEIKTWIHKFFTLWSQNQWKRERYAPSFHLDEESLDPKTWCRFPILSGGYKFELGKMANCCD